MCETKSTKFQRKEIQRSALAEGRSLLYHHCCARSAPICRDLPCLNTVHTCLTVTSSRPTTGVKAGQKVPRTFVEPAWNIRPPPRNFARPSPSPSCASRTAVSAWAEDGTGREVLANYFQVLVFGRFESSNSKYLATHPFGARVGKGRRGGGSRPVAGG